MRRKLTMYIFLLSFAVSVAIAVQRPSGVLMVRSRAAQAWSGITAEQETQSTPYYVTFALNRHPAGSIPFYVPRYRMTDHDTAVLYAGLFDMPAAYTEDEEAYLYENDNGTLRIYKYIQQIRYEATVPVNAAEPVFSGKGKAAVPTETALMDEREAVNQAAAFLEARLLLLFYEEAQVFFDGATYTVTFINRIGNIKNYAFNHTLILDGAGRVLSADYFFIKYDRLGACKIKSMWDAYAELPDDLPEGMQVRLERCQLVYLYADSIVQPAYLFEGEATGGKSFTCYVNAALYGE